MAPASAPIAPRKKKTSAMRAQTLLARRAQRRALERLGQQHLLGEDEVGAVVVGQLVVVAHRDRVEWAGRLAVAAEDAAGDVDLVHRRVALARADAVVRRVLGRDDADAVGGARRRAERAADALLQPRVLEAVQLVAAAEARVDRRLLLRVLVGMRALRPAAERRPQAAQRLAERAVGAADGAALRGAHDLDDVGSGVVWHQVSTTRIAVTRALTVARGRNTFQPSAISWS